MSGLCSDLLELSCWSCTLVLIKLLQSNVAGRCSCGLSGAVWLLIFVGPEVMDFAGRYCATALARRLPAPFFSRVAAGRYAVFCGSQALFWEQPGTNTVISE